MPKTLAVELSGKQSFGRSIVASIVAVCSAEAITLYSAEQFTWRLQRRWSNRPKQRYMVSEHILPEARPDFFSDREAVTRALGRSAHH